MVQKQITINYEWTRWGPDQWRKTIHINSEVELYKRLTDSQYRLYFYYKENDNYTQNLVDLYYKLYPNQSNSIYLLNGIDFAKNHINNFLIKASKLTAFL